MVPYESYKRLKEDKSGGDLKMTTSNEEKLLSLDEQMKQVMEDTNLDPMDKMLKYTDIMRKYMIYKDKESYTNSDTKLPRVSGNETVSNEDKNNIMNTDHEGVNKEVKLNEEVLKDKTPHATHNVAHNLMTVSQPSQHNSGNVLQEILSEWIKR